MTTSLNKCKVKVKDSINTWCFLIMPLCVNLFAIDMQPLNHVK